MNLNDMKACWHEQFLNDPPKEMSEVAFEAILSKTIRQKNRSMQYFWSYFIFQLIIYAVLARVAITHRADPALIWVPLTAMILYLPFTVILMKRFKRLAMLRAASYRGSDMPLNAYVLNHYQLIKRFYSFKRNYEFFLIPVSSAIFTWISFRLYMPGGVFTYPFAATLIYAGIVAACGTAIWAENKKHFIKPLRALEETIADIHDIETD